MNWLPRQGSSFFALPALAKSAMRKASVGSVFFHSYIGLAVIGCGLWGDNEHIGLVRHKHFAGGKKICDMDAVNRCRLQADDDRIKVFMVLHAVRDHASKFISTRLVIAK